MSGAERSTLFVCDGSGSNITVNYVFIPEIDAVKFNAFYDKNGFLLGTKGCDWSIAFLITDRANGYRKGLNNRLRKTAIRYG